MFLEQSVLRGPSGESNSTSQRKCGHPMKRMNDGSRTARKASASTEGPCADHAVDDARKALVSGGAHVMPAAATTSCLGVAEGAWDRFRTHWDKLSTDSYAADLG